MRLLRAYILREHLGPFFVTLGGLTAALLIGNIVKFAELVIAKGVSFFDILRLLLYRIPDLLAFTIPMAALVAIVLAMGRLSGDYELIAVRASGIAPIRLVIPILTVALVFSAGILVMQDAVIPQAHLAFRKQLKAVGIKRPTAYLEAGTFIRDFEPYILFVYQVEGKNLLHVRIYEPKPEGSTRAIVATRGEFQPSPDGHSIQLELYDGTVDEWDPKRPGSLYKVSFGTYTMNLSADPEAGSHIARKMKEMSFRELGAERAQMVAEGVDPLPLDIELHRKIATSFASIVFVVFGLALSLSLHHHERLIIFVWVLGIFLAYYLAAIGMNAVALKGWMPPWLAMWMPNILGLVVGGALLAKAVER